MRMFVVLILSVFSIWPLTDTIAQTIDVGLGVEKPGDDKLWLTSSYRLPITENFFIGPEVGFSRRSISSDFCVDGLGCIRRDALSTDLTTGFLALVTIPKNRFRLSFGGGGGVHFLKDEYSRVIDLPNRGLEDVETSESDVQLGAHFLGEFDVRITEKFSIFVANRNEFVRKFRDNFKLYGGVRWEF